MILRGVFNPNFFFVESSILDTANEWVIAQPTKATLNYPHSGQNVLITDSTQPYSRNANSGFSICIVWDNSIPFFVGSNLILTANFFSDLASGDSVKISISKPQSINPLDLSDKSYDYVAYFTFPTYALNGFAITGKTGIWNRFILELKATALFDLTRSTDTMYIDFLFKSDSIQRNLDGVMFDNFKLENRWLTIEETENDFLSLKNGSIFSNQLELQNESSHEIEIYLFELSGKEVLTGILQPSTKGSFETVDLQSGVYLLSVFSESKTLKTFQVFKQ